MSRRKRIRGDRVLPDVPLRLIFVVEVEIRIDRAAHGEQHSAAVARDLDAHDVALTFREPRRDVALRRRRRRAIAKIEIGADGETQDVAQIRVDLQLHVLVEQRPLRVRDREIRRYRVRILARCRRRRCRRRRRRTQRSLRRSTRALPRGRRADTLHQHSVFRSSWKVPLHSLGLARADPSSVDSSTAKLRMQARKRSLRSLRACIISRPSAPRCDVISAPRNHGHRHPRLPLT